MRSIWEDKGVRNHIDLDISKRNFKKIFGEGVVERVVLKIQHVENLRRRIKIAKNFIVGGKIIE